MWTQTVFLLAHLNNKLDKKNMDWHKRSWIKKEQVLGPDSIRDRVYSTQAGTEHLVKKLDCKILFETGRSAVHIDRGSMQEVQHHVIYSPERKKSSLYC
jgi:hypothetical protein